MIGVPQWFIVLLVLGLLSFGSIAMLVYVFAGPDGVAQKPAHQPQARSGRRVIQRLGVVRPPRR